MLLRLAWAFVLFAADPGAIAGQAPPAADGVRIVASPAGSGPDETTYEVASGSCRIRWTIARSGVNQGIAQHRAACGLPLADQITLNSRILDTVLAKEPTFRTLFLGRLTPFPEVSARLAVAAKRSARWDAKQGRPTSSETTAAYLQDLFTSGGAAIFTEWKQLFEARGLRFAVSGVEDVSVGAARTLPYFSQLQSEGIAAADRLPFDSLIWFSASRQP